MGMVQEYIVVHADKTVLRISGLKLKGINTKQLEELLCQRLHTYARVIGIAGDSIEMDVYNIEPERIKSDEKGLIKTIALAEGITLTDFAKIDSNEKIVDVNINDVPNEPKSDCLRERWMKY